MVKSNYDYNTFKQLFDAHIHYAYEPDYGVFKASSVDGQGYCIFYKLIVYSNGNGDYKGLKFTFNPKLWPQIEAFAELLNETKAEKLLYGK